MVRGIRRHRRAGSDSRCCDPSLAPLEWLDFVDASHASVVELDDWLASLPVYARLHEEGEIEALFEAASNGLLWDSNDARTPIKPIRLDPEVFELRRTALSKKLRFYHGEPCPLPNTLVALHRHIKADGPSQQSEVEHAALRYRSGERVKWDRDGTDS